jgi:hypothetical protein
MTTSSPSLGNLPSDQFAESCQSPEAFGLQVRVSPAIATDAANQQTNPSHMRCRFITLSDLLEIRVPALPSVLVFGY